MSNVVKRVREWESAVQHIQQQTKLKSVPSSWQTGGGLSGDKLAIRYYICHYVQAVK
jgi:hypothetical protein